MSENGKEDMKQVASSSVTHATEHFSLLTEDQWKTKNT